MGSGGRMLGCEIFMDLMAVRTVLIWPIRLQRCTSSDMIQTDSLLIPANKVLLPVFGWFPNHPSPGSNVKLGLGARFRSRFERYRIRKLHGFATFLLWVNSGCSKRGTWVESRRENTFPNFHRTKVSYSFRDAARYTTVASWAVLHGGRPRMAQTSPQ